MDITQQSPEEIDTQLEAAFSAKATAEARLASQINHLHHLVGDDRKVEYYGRRRVQRWGMTDDEVLARTEAEKSWDNASFVRTHEELKTLRKVIADQSLIIYTLNEEYEARGGWSRFFLVTGGHIHSSMNCSTCNNGQNFTSFGWLPALSGLTEKDAVDAHGALLCTVCYPSAPVEWTNQHELDAAKKASEKCGGTYDHEVARKNGYRRYQTCTTCGTSQSLTPNGNMRAHKAPKAS